MTITMSYEDAKRIFKSGQKVSAGNQESKQFLRAIELRIHSGKCTASALDGYLMWQTRVNCTGDEGIMLVVPPHISLEKCDNVSLSKEENTVLVSGIVQDKTIYTLVCESFASPFFNWMDAMTKAGRNEHAVVLDTALVKNILSVVSAEKDRFLCLRVDSPTSPIFWSTEMSQGIICPVKKQPKEGNRFPWDFQDMWTDVQPEGA